MTTDTDRTTHLRGTPTMTAKTAAIIADALDPDRDFSGVNWKIMYEHGIRNRIAAVARLAAERDEANARADAAEAKVRELREQVQRSGSIVYTVEEQDIEAEGRRVEVVDTGRQFNIRIQGQPVNAIKSSTEAREKAQRHIEAAARCEAIARRIETDTAVDPVAQRVDEVANIISAGIFHGTLTPDRILGIAADVVEGLTKDVDR